VGFASSGRAEARTQGASFAGGKVKSEDAASGRTEPRGAFELAVGAISRKERTVAELREWLAARDVESGEAEEAVTRLIEIGELDDERFARRYADDKRELHGWGPDRIREALVERGIDRPIAEAAAGGDGAGQQAERAADLLRGRGTNLAGEASRAKALAYLARRGYDYEVAYQAVRLAERDPDAGMGRRAA
jgi:regulatory protein